MLKVVGASWLKIRMSTWIIGMVLVLGIVVVILGQMGQLEEDGNYSATAYWNHETGFEIKFWGQGMDAEKIPKGVARIYFQPHIATTGWAVVDIETQSNYPDWVQAYSAGMLEGSLSWQLIYWHWQNTVQNVCENKKLLCTYVRKYLEENFKSLKAIYKNTDDPYWYQVYLFYMQLEGLQQGFEHGVKRSRQTIDELDFIDFLWMNAISDVVDLEHKFHDSKVHAAGTNYSYEKGFFGENNSTLLKKIRNSRSVHSYSNDNRNAKENDMRPLLGCGVTLGSTFVKFIPSRGQLFVGHNSAGLYVSMLRMIKHYTFRYHLSRSSSGIIQNKLTFSSYPGSIHSIDDFYIITMNGQFLKMLIAGTPITVFSKNLWMKVTPKRQVLSGVRMMVANRLSNNRSEWGEYFSKHNSGTGNKQWVVIDLEKFNEINRNDEDLFEVQGVLWIAEQLPGLFVIDDQTKVLTSNSYWADYGLPFYKNISKISGADAVQKIHGDAFSYTDSPLAKIYRRDHHGVSSTESIINLMRSNSYRKDPLSLGNPRCAIGARGDIPTESPYSFPIGVIDSKIFSVGEHFSNETEGHPKIRDLSTSTGSFQAIAGPAHTPATRREMPEENFRSLEDVLKPFDWAESVFTEFPHNGHPDCWDFEAISLSI